MVVDTDILAGARTTFVALFDKVMGSPAVQWSKVATPITSQSQTYTANWLGAPPQMRTFDGVLDIGKVFPHNYSIDVTERGVGIQIKERTLRLDGLGTVGLAIQNMMVMASRYYDKLAFQHYSDGFTLTGYDGAAFYADAHSVADAGTHDNKSTAAFAEAEYTTGWSTINTAKNDQGEVMGLVPSHIVVHPTNRTLVKKTLVAQTVPSGGGENVLAGDVEVVVAPDLKTTTEWHMLAAAGLAAAPVLMVETMPIRFVANDGLESTAAFHNKVFEYKVEAEVSPAYGLFQQAYGSTGTV